MPSFAIPVSNGGTLPEVRSARASLVIVERSITRSSIMTAKRLRKSLPSTQASKIRSLERSLTKTAATMMMTLERTESLLQREILEIPND
jgi:hypothetical protein